MRINEEAVQKKDDDKEDVWDFILLQRTMRFPS
jgi:hypothetical protein